MSFVLRFPASHGCIIGALAWGCVCTADAFVIVLRTIVGDATQASVELFWELD